jgi:spore coat polysaccharide biosynthesis protein SpsF (cytidylyltransferase family)
MPTVGAGGGGGGHRTDGRRQPGTSLAERYLRIAEQHGAGGVVRVATDQPLVDPVSIDRLIAAAAEPPHCDYMSFQAGDALPSGSSPLGLFAEWFRVDALCRAQPLAEPGCEHVTACLYQNPDRFHLRLIPLPAEMERFGLRLLDDDEEAWEQAQVLFDCLGPDQLEWHRIAGLLGMNAADAALAASTASYDAD